MLELINELEWNHFIIIGLLLIITEMITFTFILLGLGVSFIIVGLTDLIFEPDINILLVVFITSIIGFFILWLKFHKEKVNYKQNKYLEIRGSILEVDPKMKVRFDEPVLGSTIWTVKSENKLDIEDRVEIENIDGQLIKVRMIL